MLDPLLLAQAQHALTVKRAADLAPIDQLSGFGGSTSFGGHMLQGLLGGAARSAIYAPLGGVVGGVAGGVRGNIPEGVGRGVLQGGALGMGAGLGAGLMGGLTPNGVSGSTGYLLQLLGSAGGGLSGLMLARHLQGRPVGRPETDSDKDKIKDKGKPLKKRAAQLGVLAARG